MSTLHIGLIGLGTVGQGVVELLRRHADLYAARSGKRIEVVAVLIRDAAAPRDFAPPPGALLTTDPEAFFATPCQVIVEVAGGVDRPLQWITRALESGRDVVTANKALLAVHAAKLFGLAEKHRRRLLFEAAVAGGVPVIQMAAAALAANRLSSFAGILNGTCNFILTHMSRGGSYEEALREAQRRGFAEADPGLDVSGRDSLEKLCILASLVFGAPIAPEQVSSDGITKLTEEDLKAAAAHGSTIKLLACARMTDRGVELWNGPTFVPLHSPLGLTSGSEMGVLFRGDAMSHVFVGGDGAGRFPTASAVVSDLLEAARLVDARPAGRLNPWPVGAAPIPIAPILETIEAGRRGALIRALRI